MSATPLDARSDPNSLITERGRLARRGEPAPSRACASAPRSIRGAADGSCAAASCSRMRSRSWSRRSAVGAIDSGAHTLSHPPLIFGGLFAWIALAWLYGNYTQDELRMAHSTADDVPGLVLLAAATTWAGQLADATLGVNAPPVGKLARLLPRARGAGDDAARVRAHGRAPLGHADRADARGRHRSDRAARGREARRAPGVRDSRDRLRRRRPGHRPDRRRALPRPHRRDRAARRASTACTA